MNNFIKKGIFPIISFICLFLSIDVNAQCPASACNPFGFPDNFLDLGTTNFTLNTINHNTNDRSIDPSYNDYSCSISTNLVVGTSYNVALTTTNGYFIHTEIWIDIDNNGFFNPFTESFFVTENFINQTGTITLPSSGVVLNTPLRLRILTEERNQDPFDPCGLPKWGQVEDYSIVALANNNPPIANFSANATVLCGGVVTFNDLSTNSPTSWLWNFGDGNTSTDQNPTHTYSSPGTYTVTLTSTNTFGFDSEVKTNYINNSSNSPVSNCTPGNVTNPGILSFGCGIYNFQLNTINKNSAGAADGYQDYTCNQQTNLFESTPYNVNITTGSNFDELVKIFVDVNGDGTFQANEELYSNSGLISHSGTITIPNTAIKDSLLRLRVTSDYIGAVVPTACSTPTHSQVEDYTVIVQINNNPPVADFEVEEQISCDGFFKFKDLSINGVVDWFWDFGDGFTSILKNPSHTYINTGEYTVKLKTTNANGIDSIVKVDYVQYHDTIPVAANCDPVTNNYCCSYGISNFTFGSINNSTENGFVGYEDFTCKIRTNLIEGQSYPVTISTSSSFNQKTKIWIDYNNDGLFTDSSEIVFTSVDTQNPTGNIIIGSNVVYNTPLRLRVISDYASSSFTSCFNITHGQAEDYTVIIEQNVFPPVSEFDADPKVTCSNTISFFDESLNAPNSYFWDFGDGATSDLKNPVHVYENPGLYTVTLIVENESGSDTTTKVDFINYQPSPISSCIPTTVSYCCNTGVQRFILNDIDNTSRDASIPYEDFSCLEFTTLKSGAKYPVKVTTGSVLSEHVIIWIDLNNDGEFDNETEQVYTSTQLQNHFGEIDIPRTAVYDTSLRMRVTSESSSSPIPSGCSNLFNGQHEDYSIVLLEPDPLSINFSNVNSKIRVYPNPSNGIINIQNDSDELISEVSIINSLGEIILEKSNFNGQSINLDNISSGLYIIQIKTKLNSINRNIIINEK